MSGWTHEIYGKILVITVILKGHFSLDKLNSVGIPLADLTLPQLYVGSKPGPKFPVLYVIMFVLGEKVRGDGSFY